MQTRDLIILLLLILVAAVVIALVVRRGNAKRAEEHDAEAEQVGTQAAWLGSGDEPTETTEDVEPAAAPVEGSEEAPTLSEPVAEPLAEPVGEAVDQPAVEADAQTAEVPMTRAERREAREAAEGAQAQPEPQVEGTDPAGPAWTGAGAETDPDAERIAAAAGFRDEVSAGDALSQDIAIPANEWGGPREDALDEEPTVENPVEDDLPAAGPQEDEPEVVAEDVAPVEEPSVEEPVAEEPAVEEPPVEEPAVEEPAAEQTGRRISGFLELRDGGFGVGSAAPLEDGAQPLNHPVQAYRDTMTFRVPGDAGYDSAEPDVWFYDAGAAERSGFRPSDG